MAFEIECRSFSKRTNSTKVPNGFDKSYFVTLKDRCDWNNPVFLISDDDFPYNYVKWGKQYYFVNSVAYVRNGLLEVSCSTDVLATFKGSILGSTQFVSYSSVSGGAWLADTRIPVLQNAVTAKNEVALPIFNNVGGWYITSIIGKNGCDLFALTAAQLIRLTTNVQTDAAAQVVARLKDLDFTSVETGLKSFAEVMTNNDIFGNAYANAPECIRSCTWVPFVIPETLGDADIYLGNFNTDVSAARVSSKPFTGSVTISIPWHYSDWRRGYCEEVYLYLPLVGMVSLSVNSIVNETALTVNYSYTVTDGAVAFQIIAGNQVIGSYGGSCFASYPIGVNQKASAGEILNTYVNGIDKTFATALSAGLDVVGVAAGAVEGSLSTAYHVADTAFSTHPSCIGGIGGGAGYGLSKNITCFTVSHPTVIEPAQMQATMGVPTMKPLQLSNCSGYCQCANAHVAISGHLDESRMIDMYLNSGFYIE